MFDVFVENPAMVMVVAGAFFIAFVVFTLWGRIDPRFRGQSFLYASVSWGVYALWEAFLVGKGMNIRVDLFFIYPLLLIASIIACLRSYRWKKPPAIGSKKERSGRYGWWKWFLLFLLGVIFGPVVFIIVLMIVFMMNDDVSDNSDI